MTALAVLNIAWAKNATAKSKPKRQLDNIRTPQNLQYSLVLPHSRVQHFRSLNTNTRRISHGAARGGKLPPYAVQMEPVVQYSQKDPLYDPKQDNLDDSVVNQNEIYAQSKILNTHDSEESFGPPYGSLPTAPLYSHEPHPQYYEAPEPIIEIIIKESNETLPAPPPPPVQKKKKEPVHVFYVKYSKDPHSHDKVIYEKPIPAITPPSNEEDHEDYHHQEYITVTPEPYIPVKTTTLRAIIKPESEVYHSDSSVKVTFGNEGHHSHYSDRREGGYQNEQREETAPRPAIAFPNQPPQQNPPQETHSPRSAPSQLQFSHGTETKSTVYHPNTYRPSSQHAQSRIQFQPLPFPTEQQLPSQNPTSVPFRSQTHAPRHPFGSPSSLIPNPAFANGPPGIIEHFNGPTSASPLGPVFPTSFPRPSNPSFHSRPSNAPAFTSRINGPPKSSFHSGPQRPFHQSPPKQYFDEAKYLQENYHTITNEQDPPKAQPLPSHQSPTFSRLPTAGPSPTPQFQSHFNRPQVPLNQQLPQQRPSQHFVETIHSKPSLTISPSSSPFFNLKPSPPRIENNRPPFQQASPQFNFHQGPGPSAIPSQQSQHSFSSPVTASPSPISHNQFLPQPSSPTLYNFRPSPSSPPDQVFFQRPNSPSERPQFQSHQGPSERPHGPSERPKFQSHQGPSDRPQFQQQGPTDRPQFQHQGPSERPQFQQQGPSERPQFQQQVPSERPHSQQSHGQSERPTFSQQNQFQDQSNINHQQHVNQFVPNGGELIPAISKYEQHITVNGPTGQPNYNLLSESSQPSPAPSHNDQQYQHLQQQQERERHQHQQQQKQQHQEHQHQLHQQQKQQQQEHQHQLHQQQQQHQEQQHQQQQQQQQYESEQEQVRQQLAHNVRKQQEEIQRLQAQLLLTHQQQQVATQYNNQQIESSSPRSQYIQERSRAQSSTALPPYYQSTSRTVEIRPTTQKYVSSTINSVSSTPKPERQEKKKPTFELPDEVPDDLRQQLLSSGILDNADISILDYDKVGETPLDSLPPDQLANFFSAGGGQQIAASENRPIYVKPNGDEVESRIVDDMEDDQDIAASENIPSYVSPPPSNNQAVEMKVVHFDPNTAEGQKIANEYVQENATQADPVALNDKKYNRYLPLKVSGNQFPLPDILKGRKVTSVVVLAPVETEALSGDHSRKERSASNTLKGIKFVAGDSLQNMLKKPTTDNFQKWLDVEKKTATDLQSIILLVTG